MRECDCWLGSCIEERGVGRQGAGALMYWSGPAAS